MNKTKTICLIALLLLSVISIVSVSAAFDPLGIEVNQVKVNGDSLTANQAVKTQFEKDSELEIKVILQTNGTATVKDVEVNAFITGGKDDISDTTKPFDVVPNTIYTKSLSLELPERLSDRTYQLRVIVSSPNSETISYTYPLLVDAVDSSIAIKEATFSPNKVTAGRAFTAIARLKNYGKEDEDDVKVVVSIPELGIQEVDYVDEIEKDKTVSTEEILLRVPANTKSGVYSVEVTAYFDDYDEDTTAKYSIEVVGDSQAAQSLTGSTGKTTISVGLQAQTAARGENGVVFPLTLTNDAITAKTYTLVISGAGDWATTKISPSNVIILNAGESKQAYVYAAANENTALGEHVFSVDVKAGNDIVQQIPLKVDVVESIKSTAWDGVKKALQVGVILLVVLIVILGVILVYQKRSKSAPKEDEQIAQTYY